MRAVDISPLDTIKTLSYDDLKILMETLEKEANRMATNASHLAGERSNRNNGFETFFLDKFGSVRIDLQDPLHS